MALIRPDRNRTGSDASDIDVDIDRMLREFNSRREQIDEYRQRVSQARAEVRESIAAVEVAQQAITEPVQAGKPATLDDVLKLDRELAELKELFDVLKERLAVLEEQDNGLQTSQDQSAQATLALVNELREARLAAAPDAEKADERARIGTLVGIGGLIIGAAGVIASLI